MLEYTYKMHLFFKYYFIYCLSLAIFTNHLYHHQFKSFLLLNFIIMYFQFILVFYSVQKLYQDNLESNFHLIIFQFIFEYYFIVFNVIKNIHQFRQRILKMLLFSNNQIFSKYFSLLFSLNIIWKIQLLYGYIKFILHSLMDIQNYFYEKT